MSTIALAPRRTTRTAARPDRHLRAVPDATTATHVRLTRRGKLVVLALAVAVIAVLAIVLGSSSIAGNESGAAPETTTVRVLPGTTLWEVATEANPNGDIRQTVDEIVRLNSLPNASALQMGSEIAVPVYS
jgi:cell division protein YceG involved in septum cleavage